MIAALFHSFDSNVVVCASIFVAKRTWSFIRFKKPQSVNRAM